MTILNVILVLFAGTILVLNAFSLLLQRFSLPAPTLALAVGALVGPVGFGLIRIEDFATDPHRLLEEVARLTLGVGLAGVALRLPHGYWRENWRWILASIGLGMLLMLAIATGVLWLLLGTPLVLALLVGAVITPTDPIVTTPIVTGTLAQQLIPSRVRYNLSAESGINDGLGYLFVLIPVLLLTEPDGEAWTELLTRVLLWEVLGAAVLGAVAGYLAAKLFLFVVRRGLIEQTSYLGFILALALVVLGGLKLLQTDGVLGVFVAAAVFGQMVPRSEAQHEEQIDETVNRFVALPGFLLLGLALPVAAWVDRGLVLLLAVVLALVARRVLTIWAVRPVFSRLHSKAETLFMSWFAPVGMSALFYATLAERRTGETLVFDATTLAITVSVLLYGLTATPASKWLHARVAPSRLS